MRAALRYIAFESTISPTIAACYRKYSDKYSKVDIVHDLTLVLDTLWTFVYSLLFCLSGNVAPAPRYTLYQLRQHSCSTTR